MNFRIVAIGKLKEKYLRQGIEEYKKRLQSYGRLEIVELKGETFKEPLSEKERLAVMAKEAGRIKTQLGPRSFLCVLDRTGLAMSSDELSARIEKLALTGTSTMTFVIGGALGLDASLVKQADLVLSFSSFTFPHQLMRLILVEQVYRAMTISRGELYHK